MPTTIVPRTSYRPPVRRMSHKQLQETHSSSTELENSYNSAIPRWSNRMQSQVAPETNNPYPWRSVEQPPPRNLDDDERKKCNISRGWFWFFGGVFCLILIVAIVAVVLGVILPMTTTAPNSNTTPSK